MVLEIVSRGNDMDRLWAPWRIHYIKQPKIEGCIFCEKWNDSPEKDKENHVVYRGKEAFALLNIYPYNNGHLMVAPTMHVASAEDLSEQAWLEIITIMKLMVTALRGTLHPHGFNIGMNVGRVAGAGIDDHVHLHIVPRWNGDTNFMPILTDTKVLHQSLDEVHHLLVEYLNNHGH